MLFHLHSAHQPPNLHDTCMTPAAPDPRLYRQLLGERRHRPLCSEFTCICRLKKVLASNAFAGGSPCRLIVAISSVRTLLSRSASTRRAVPSTSVSTPSSLFSAFCGLSSGRRFLKAYNLMTPLAELASRNGTFAANDWKSRKWSPRQARGLPV